MVSDQFRPGLIPRIIRPPNRIAMDELPGIPNTTVEASAPPPQHHWLILLLSHLQYFPCRNYLGLGRFVPFRRISAFASEQLTCGWMNVVQAYSPLSQRNIISDTANMPRSTGTSANPSQSDKDSNVMRACPVTLSAPTKDRRRPRKAAISPRVISDFPRTAMKVGASIASMKNSGGPKNSTTSRSTGNNNASTKAPNAAPKEHETIAAPTACPARPFSVIGGPSSRVAAFCPVPVVLNGMAVRPSPWATVECAPKRKTIPIAGSIL